MEYTSSYAEILKQELARRSQKNPAYSLRSFARALQVSPGSLSLVLSEKRIPSAKLTKKLLDVLGLPPDREALFLESLTEAQKGRRLQRANTFLKALQKHSKAKGKKALAEAKELQLDLFQVIGDWHHFAIMMLVETEGAQTDPKWMAKELGITQLEALLAVDRMVRLGILKRKGDKLTVDQAYLTTADKNITTPALRKLQKQVLEKAIHSLENDPIEERSTTAVTMAIDPARLPQAKKMIDEFNQTLCEFLEGGERKQVYQLGVSLYPLQKKK